MAHGGRQHLQRFEPCAFVGGGVEAHQVLQQRGVQRSQQRAARLGFGVVQRSFLQALELAQVHELGTVGRQGRFEHGWVSCAARTMALTVLV